MEDALGRLAELDWHDIELVSACTHPLLTTLSGDKTRLRHLVQQLPNSADLLALCEHYDFMDKLVLHRDQQDRFRVRMHRFLLRTHKDRPHWHRWVSCGIILCGSLQHLIYGTEDDFKRERDIRGLRPSLVVRLEAGSAYCLNHDIVHSVWASPDTVSLVIRGPAVKDRFLVMDRRTGDKWWEYGRELETTEEVRRRRMSLDRLQRLMRDMRDMGVI